MLSIRYNSRINYKEIEQNLEKKLKKDNVTIALNVLYA